MIRGSAPSSLEELEEGLMACNAKQQGGIQAKETVMLDYQSFPIVIPSDKVLLVEEESMHRALTSFSECGATVLQDMIWE